VYLGQDLFGWNSVGLSLPKSVTELRCIVRRTKKKAKNDAKYKIQLDQYTGLNYLPTTFPFRSNQAK
jgi:hypothetical protein